MLEAKPQKRQHGSWYLQNRSSIPIAQLSSFFVIIVIRIFALNELFDLVLLHIRLHLC